MEEKSIGGNPFEMAEAEEAQQNGSSGEGFFEALENNVNSVVADSVGQVSEATQPEPVAQTVTHANQEDPNSDTTNWRKRYKDSSREAKKMNSELKDLKPFVPLLNAMKEDSGLVEHVRDYLQNGGNPKSVKEQLGLDEEFIYDQSEALEDPESDSAKLFNETVSRMVQQRVNGVMQQEAERNKQIQYQKDRKAEELQFKAKYNMSDEEYDDMIEKSKSHILSLEDVYTLVNRDKVQANTANATKQDMMNQMKNVQNIPTSVSSTNNAGEANVSAEDQIFNALAGSDSDLDNLFE